jgi:hypothetical protein
MKPNMPHSTSWIVQTYVSFVVSLGGTLVGIWYMPADLWTKSFLGMGVLFTVSSCLALAKTVRDQHEAQNLHHKLEDARATKLLREVDAELEDAIAPGRGQMARI